MAEIPTTLTDASWIDGTRLFERHAWDTSKFRLAALGQRLKEVRHAD